MLSDNGDLFVIALGIAQVIIGLVWRAHETKQRRRDLADDYTAAQNRTSMADRYAAVRHRSDGAPMHLTLSQRDLDRGRANPEWN